MEIHQTLLPFLQSQKILTVATIDGESPWVCNVYFSVNDKYEFFFFSNVKANHSKHLELNEKTSFTTVWQNPDDDGDRKAIQATGVCRQVKDPVRLLKLVKHHYQYFPSWKKKGETLNDVVQRSLKTGAYIIEPDYIKYWNDGEFGDERVEEYRL